MEKKEMYYTFGMGNKGRWLLPVEVEPTLAKSMQDDGLQIIPLPNFVRTDSMKVYFIEVKGNSMRWLLSIPLDPEVAQEMINNGVKFEETFNTTKYDLIEGKLVEKEVNKEDDAKEEVADYFWKEVKEEPVKKTKRGKVDK